MTSWREVYDRLGINFEDRKRSVYCGAWRHIPAKPATVATDNSQELAATTIGVTPYEASRQDYIAKHGKEPKTDRISFTRVNSDDLAWRKKAQHEIERMRALFTANSYRDDLKRALEDFQHGHDSLTRELESNRDLNALFIGTIDKSKLRTFEGKLVK